MKLIEKILRIGERAHERHAQQLTDATLSLEDTYAKMTDEKLQAQTDEFRARLKDGETTDHILPEAFAVVREATYRTLKKRQYPVQLMGGIALHRGQVAEMGTGEGKAVSVETLIPTPVGAVPARTIRQGDTIYAGSGQLTAVLGVFPQGTKRAWRVTLEDGRFIDCDLSHLWDVQAYGERGWRTLCTEEMVPLIEDGVDLYLPRNGAVAFALGGVSHPARTIESVPWQERIYLGCSSTTENTEDSDAWAILNNLISQGVITHVSDRLDKDLHHYHLDVKKAHEVEGNLTPVLARTIAPEIPVGVSNPVGSTEQTKILLAHTKNGFDGAHEAWCEANAQTIAWCARSLGYSATITPSNEGSVLPWSVRVNKHPSPRVKIVSIRDTGRDVEQVCFKVSDPSHLFLAGDHVVTHNTLTAVAPLYLNALAGEGAHLVTTNDYLAREQAEQMGRVFNFLGLSCDAIQESMDSDARREVYSCDVVYGTNNQFGFDYLRDNLVRDPAERVQRGLNYVIIDELDSILLDEATTPLIISGAAELSEEAERWFLASAHFVKTLTPDVHYEADKKMHTVKFLDAGLDEVENYFGIDGENLFGKHSELLTFLNASLQAHALFDKDKDYVILNGEVMIVDTHTGRVLPGRRFNGGIHQAIEAKEQANGNLEVAIKPETPTTATITLQNFFRLYKKMSGMTGTAASESAELADTYDLVVRTIPPNKPKQRIDLHDEIYISETEKFEAIVREIKDLHNNAEGTYTTHDHKTLPLVQPILIGTTSVAASERLSRLLTQAGINHNVLNAKHIEKEAHIIAQAGRLAAVTVSTNMAGRGTDILLGGNPEMLVQEQLTIQGLTPKHTPHAYNEQYNALLPTLERQVAEEAQLVRNLGGLYVIGTERHDSRRIDNQLIGRSGRQGDPGKSKFFLSLDDELFRLHGTHARQKLTTIMQPTPNEPLTGNTLTKSIAEAQANIDGQHRTQRKNTLEYDNVLNAQRTCMYNDRNTILTATEQQIHTTAQKFITHTVHNTTQNWLNTHGTHTDDWNLNNLWKHLHTELNWTPTITPQDIHETYPNPTELNAETITNELTEEAKHHWKDITTKHPDTITQHTREAILQTIDQNWTAHLANLDYLKDGIGLRALAQKDPKIEYKIESAELFDEMNEQVKKEFTQLALGRL